MKAVLHLLIACFLTTTVQCSLSVFSCPGPGSVKYVKIGCYSDVLDPATRAMKTLLVQGRQKGIKSFGGNKIDWNNYGTFLPKFICDCAQRASAKGFSFFGIQFYGECWSSSDAESRYALYGSSDKCVNTEYKDCLDNSNKACSGKDETNYVYQIVQAIDGGFTEWVEDCCSATCGNGVKKLTRACTNPPPQNGGKPCDGPLKKVESCNTIPCPIDGGYSDWVEHCCSKTCGDGIKKFKRTCTNPPPQHGGKLCEGPSEKTEPCNTTPCPDDGSGSKELL